MLIDRFMPMVNATKSYQGRMVKATPGERVFSALFPNRGSGWPGGWSQDRVEQVCHLKNWTYVAIDAIASMMGRLTPNFAYVRHQTLPGKTQKAGEVGNRFWEFGRNPDTWDFRGGEKWSAEMQAHTFNLGGYHRKALSVVKPHEDLEPLPHNHQLRRLFDNPNPYDTSFDLLYELDMFLELCGVAYLWAIPNGFGKPCELWVIPSHWVWPRTGGGGGNYIRPDDPYADKLIHYYEIRPWGGMGTAGSLKFPPNEVIMINWKSPMNKIDGYSKLAATAQWIDTEESITKSRWAQFMNQARPDLHIELGEGYEDPTDAQMRRIEAKFLSRYQGEYNFGKPIITPPGAKVTPLGWNPTEMSYFQSEEQIRDMILSTFRVPKSVVGISSEMTFGSILATLSQFCVYCINPRLAMLGQKLTKDLATHWSTVEEPIRIWYDDTTPHDPTQINADIDTDVRSGAITPNEIRALRGRKPYRNGGDDPLMPGPGGTVPLPLNTGDDLTELAELVPVLGGKGQVEEQEAMGDMPSSPQGVPNAGQLPKPDDTENQDELVTNANVEEPNGPPSEKGLKGGGDNTPHTFCSTQFNLVDAGYSRSQGSPLPLIREFIDAIPDALLAEDGKEDTPHVTVKYGLHTDNVEDVASVVSGFGCVELKLGGISIFPANETDAQRGGAQYEVMKIDVESPQLHKLNALLSSKLECADTHPTYHPHITLAYLKSGSFAKLRWPSFAGKGMSVACCDLTFSNKERDTDKISLIQTNAVGKAVSKSLTKEVGPTNLIHLPDLEQSTDFHCGPNALLSIAEYFGVGPESEQSFAELLGSDPINGTNPQKIVELGKELGLQVNAQHKMDLNQLKAEIDAGKPTLVLIQAYSGTNTDANEDNGHYVIVIGMDQDNVYVEDPMLKGERGVIPIREFVERWRDAAPDGTPYVRWGASFWREDRFTSVAKAPAKPKKKAIPAKKRKPKLKSKAKTRQNSAKRP